MSRRSIWIASLAVAAAVASLPLLTDDRYLLKVLTFVGIECVTVVGLGLKAGGSYSVRHVAEGGAITEIGTFVAHRASWSAEFAMPGFDLKSLGGGSIELVDGDGTVVMRS